ncbi:diversity-generating retroelement protein Avd [Halomonas sp. IOP_31]|uniref:diversity-generating retroelement protein Avd n=1 Tax=Halomonas sp. IOP_31 TaxID=2876584 RepID=UPI001E4F16F9|nr:diversity-generating retroelement protein Avd [Halomonas sp. IOP_31]MCD6006911.1 diversity-generating retroelement protein Avd [Halomonas sp. IOP_31]
MSHVDPGHDQGRGSAPRQHLRPFEAMITKLEELDDYSHVALRQYPKAERHLLAADTRQCLDKILRLTLAAWKRYHKKTTLGELDVEIEVLRHLVRKAERLRFITPRRYKVWAEHINELGRMLGGWLRAQRA